MVNCEFKRITMSDLFNNYMDNAEEGVSVDIKIDGKLIKTDIRPPYQREFVYSDDKRDKVIDTLVKNLPLGIVYLAKNNDGTMEVIDGQQRILSICKYLNGEYSVNGICDYLDNKNFNVDTMKDTTIYEQIMSYDKLLVYIVEGSEDEKLAWFKTINIAGEKLTEQELLNANYVGEWLTDAKRKFSKSNCAAYKLGKDYVKGSPIRQDFLETALDWISDGNIAQYMSEHQSDANANELYLYFNNVINWIKVTFGDYNYRREMLGINWGRLYNKYHNNIYDTDALEEKIFKLMANEEVTDKKGIYEYVLSGENPELARKLSKRTFCERDKRTAYERQKGICPIMNEHYAFEDMEADHIIPWWLGGTTTLDNLQMVWKHANRMKGGKV